MARMRAVTFDLWHTLLFLSPAQEELYMADQIEIGLAALRDAPLLPGGEPSNQEELRAAFEHAYAGAIAAASDGRAVSPATQFAQAARRCSRHSDPSNYLTALHAEVDRTPFEAAPGALELLRGLREEGYRIGVISNTVGEPGEFLRPVLAKFGFDRYVETYVFSDEHPWAKPAPEIFRYALDRLGSRPVDAVHVGDGPSDTEGAGCAGYRGSILFTGLHDYGPKYRELFMTEPADRATASSTATSLAEVGRLIRELLPSR
jgi:HAD superfamily hydrolase (TIGR01549 family)